MFVRILAQARKPELKVTAKNEVEAARIRYVKSVLAYCWRYSLRAFKVKLPFFDLYLVRRK